LVQKEKPMTVDTVRLLARYNAHANAEMNLILATLTPEEWEADRGGYFSSFRSLTSHIYTADVTWLVRFTGLRPFGTVRGEPFDFPPNFGTPAFGGFDEYLALRQRLDGRLQEFAAEVTDADLAQDLAFRTSRGDPHTMNFGGLILHMFNHQTHHRGSVSLLLDQMKKTNDYSNIMRIL